MKEKLMLKFKSFMQLGFVQKLQATFLSGLQGIFWSLKVFISHLLIIMIGFYFGAILMGQKCHARIVHYGSETETVTLAYGGATILRFNEQVKTISRASRFKISPADSQDPDYTTLSVIPRFMRGEDKVTFLLANGAVISMKLVTVPKEIPEKTDSFYDFIPKEQLIAKETGEGAEITDLDLMKAMIGWQSLRGYEVRSLVRTINTRNDNLSAKLVRVYTGPRYNGYIFKLQNFSTLKKYHIDLKDLKLGMPSLALLSQIDSSTLDPQGKGVNATFLRIVAKPTSVYYNINLPVGPIKNSSSQN